MAAVDNLVDNDMDYGGPNAATTSGGMKLGFVSGVIARERIVGFERMLWRVCRGNVFVRQAELPELIEDPTTVKFNSIERNSISHFLVDLGRTSS